MFKNTSRRINVTQTWNSKEIFNFKLHNHTTFLNGKTRSYLNTQKRFVKVYKHLWNELVNVLAYIFNLCPTKENAYMIPYEKNSQSNQTWEYLNFWMFCSCTLAKDNIINKFGVISISYTFVGCDSNYKSKQVVQ
jgi:hypothetical protein